MTNKSKTASTKAKPPATLCDADSAILKLAEETARKVVKVETDGDNKVTIGSRDPEHTAVQMCKTFGTTDYKSSEVLLTQLVELDEHVAKRPLKVQGFLHMVNQINPQDSLEGMLASQMVATQHVLMGCARRAELDGQTFEGRQLNLNSMVKLARTFTMQMDALGRKR